MTGVTAQQTGPRADDWSVTPGCVQSGDAVDPVVGVIEFIGGRQ